MVRTRNNNSAWSEPASFTFTIRPPFWKTWWFRTIGILLASFILLLIFRTQIKRVNKKAALQNQLRNLEMKALKAQMNPHFVYNALNSIQSLVIDNRQQEALDYMVKFGRLLRQVLNHSEQNVVTLDKELATLELYIQLEALRLHYSLNYSIDVDENIITEKEFIPPLILQPFVENALWHGLGEKEGDKNLFVHIYGDDQWLYCRVADNGVGRSATDKKIVSASYREGPRGMEITTNRLKTYNADKGTESILISDNLNPNGTSAGTTVTVRIRRH
jgi:LytS/YehU family sensor histidine kinase